MLCNDLSCTFVDDSSMIITLYRYTFINAAFECIWFREKLQTNSGRVGVVKVFAGPWSSGCHQISCSLGEDPGFMSTPLVITFLLPDGRSTHLVSGIFHFRGHNTQRTSRKTSSMGLFSEVIYLVYTSCIYQIQCHQSIFRQVSGKHIHDLWQCETSNARWWACSGSGTCVYKVFAADRGSIYCVYKRHLLLTYTNIHL